MRGLAIVLLIACAAALVDHWMYPDSLRVHGQAVPTVRNATLPEMLAGAACRRHSTNVGDYFDIRVHWPYLALALAIPVFLHFTLGASRRRWARVASVLLGTVGFLAAMELLVLEAELVHGPFRPDPDCIWAMKANLDGSMVGGWQRTSQFGYRRAGENREATKHVVLLGDSSTFGVRITDDRETFGWVLSENLPDDAGVINRGIPGYSSWQGVQMYHRLPRKYKADVVVVSFMANDWTPAAVPDSALQSSEFVHSARRLLWHSHTYLLLDKLVAARAGPAEADAGATPPRDAGPRVPIGDYEKNLEAIRALCERDGARMVVVALPMHPRLTALSQPYRDALAAFSKRSGVTFLDLFTEAGKQPGYQSWFADDDPIHPDARGHAFIGQRLAETVKPLLEEKR